ncbi:SPOSA6832_00757 [Sporobolomyces salmonicolor]|uniref:SPOSA6832_00757-mRNA-1:cds n=1 Tax=Sporidiobolus salmonicolor TaxID=5005 RepID=A0A0D6EGU0_SPOSA|nr:SPOSA6832_00757 [Sporobolomyces salmonicolor]
MDVDEIFKRPPLPKAAAAPGASNKRKFEPPSFDPESYKSVKLEDQAAASHGKGKARAGVTIQDGSDDEDGPQNAAEFAPGQDADYFAEEDEDGRFLCVELSLLPRTMRTTLTIRGTRSGGGLSSIQKQVLNLMDTAPGAESTEPPGEDLTPQSVRKQLLNLERTVNKNRDLRTKFPTDPEKFVDSEFNLIEALHGLLLLSTSPTLTYPLLIENSTPNTLADLLSHENADVSSAVIEVLEEWVDPEGLEDQDDEEADEEVEEKKRQALKSLVDALVEADIVTIAVAGLERFNEEDEDQRTGVFHTLSLIENLLTLSPALASPLLSRKSPFLPYLVNRLSLSNKPPEWDQNRYYAAEMLALVLSLPPQVVDAVIDARMRVGEDGWTDALLKVLSVRCLASLVLSAHHRVLMRASVQVYRKRDPASADETEFMENVFDALCSCLSSAVPPSTSSASHPVKSAFLAGEGVELMLLLLKSKHPLARTRALKCLSHALQSQKGAELCERFVECLGLKTLFATFMGKGGSSKKKSSAPSTSPETTEHVLSILSSLFTSLPSDSQPRTRLLAKFVENDYEKLDRLAEVREELEARIAKGVDQRLIEEMEMAEDEVYIEKLENGLFALQLADYVAAWVCMEDDGAREHLVMLLSRRDKSLKDTVAVLSEYRDNINVDGTAGAAPGEIKEEDREPTEGEMQRAILDELVRYLESIA